MRDFKPAADRPHKSLFFRSLSRLLTIENSIIGLFAVLGIIGILNHEMWRDEMQAWLLAKDSGSLLGLIRNSRYEGHPLLWHICLYGLAKITHNPLIMQGFHLSLAICSVALIVKTSVFSLLQKGLLSFSYFLFYEYSIISRNYAIGVLLAFLFCTLYTKRRPNYWLLSAVLVLLANTNIFGLFISFALGTAMLYRLFTELRPSLGVLLRYAALLLAGWGLCLLQIARAMINDTPAGPSVVTSGTPTNFENAVIPSGLWDKLDELGKLAELIVKSYLPLPQLRVNSWNSHLLFDDSLFPHVGPVSLGLLAGIAIAAIAVLISIKILWKTPLYLWVYVVSSGLITVFHSVIFRGAVRHYGHFFIVLLISLWLATWSQRQQARDRSSHTLTARTPVLGGTFLTILLIFQVVSGLYAYTLDLFYPFSVSRETAQFIQRNELENIPLFSAEDRYVITVSGYLDRPVYYAQRGEFGSFWGRRYPEIGTPQAVADSIDAFEQQHSDFLVVSKLPINLAAIAASAVELAKFDETTIEGRERLYLYRVRSR